MLLTVALSWKIDLFFSMTRFSSISHSILLLIAYWWPFLDRVHPIERLNFISFFEYYVTSRLATGTRTVEMKRYRW